MATSPYLDSIQLIQRLHRQFLDVLKQELDRKGVQDINAVQSMILFNIGDEDLTVGELTIRGYYEGTNVSYNVKKMVENDYLIQERSVHDKRSLRVRLSEKGQKLRAQITDMFSRHEKLIANTDLTADRLSGLNATMTLMERFWVSQTNFGGRAVAEDFD